MARSKYVNPVPPGTKTMRPDKGQDYQGTPGQKVVAIGKARIDAIKQDPGGFGIAIYYTLLDGPSKGQQIYVGHAQPTVKVGKIVKAGQPVATLLKSGLGDAAGLPGWVEIGLAANGVPQYTSPHGGPALQRLLRGAGTPAPTEPLPADPSHQTTPTTTDPTGVDVQNELYSAIGNIPQVNVTAAPVHAPLVGDYVDTNVTPVQTGPSTWQMIASQGSVSQDTLRLASLASLASNASGQ